jgi:KDO2-lipid IV(A) lauroyltransferase
MSFKVRWFIGFLSFCRCLPLPLNHGLGTLLGLVYMLFPSRDRQVAWINLSIAFPKYTHWQRLWLLIGFFKELGKTVTELGKLWLSPPDQLWPLIRRVEGIELIEAALQGGKGILFMTPHIGAWELSGLYVAHAQVMTTLYQPPDYADLADFITRARERTGAKLVPTDVSGVRALLAALKHNQVVGILPDQDPGENGGVFAPFFSLPAYTMLLAGRLAQKTDARVLLIACERLSWGRGYCMHLTTCNPDIFSSDLQISATALNKSIEQMVACFPTQYIWNYKRWRRQPDGADPYQRKR